MAEVSNFSGELPRLPEEPVAAGERAGQLDLQQPALVEVVAQLPPLPQSVDLVSAASQGTLAATEHVARRYATSQVRRLASATLALSLISGGIVAVESIVTPTQASADDGGYPYPNVPCVWSPYSATGTGNYCKKVDPVTGKVISDYDWGTVKDDNGNDSEISPYGYAYRNCTDFVAWKLSTLGVKAAQYKGLGDAKKWVSPPSANKLTVDTTPAAGAAGVDTSGDYGHVVFVDKVDSIDASNFENDKIEIEQYNQAQNGTYSTATGTVSSFGLDDFVHFEAYETSAPTSTPPPPPPTPSPVIAALVTPDGDEHVYSGVHNGEIYETWWGPSSPTPTTWEVGDVGTQITGISADVTPDGDEHVYYGTNAGVVGEFWWGPTSGGVHAGHEFDSSNPITALSSETTPDGDQHVYSANTLGEIDDTFWAPNSSTTTTNQIEDVGLNIAAISSQVTPDGDAHVFFGTTNGTVGQVWVSPGANNGNLGYVSSVGDMNITAMSSQVTSDGVLHAYSALANGEIDETQWAPAANDATTTELADVGNYPSVLSSEVTSDGNEHVYFGTSFGEIGELWWGATSGGVHLGQHYTDPAGLAITGIASALNADGTQNIFSANTQGTMLNMWWNGSGEGLTDIGSVS